MIYSFTLAGEIPSKKNSRTLIYRGGRPFSIPGHTYQNWHKSTVLMGKAPKTAISSQCEVFITIYPGTKRKADLTNKAESIMDFLVDVGVLEDDNHFIVGKLTLMLGDIDKKNPRACVTINTHDKSHL